jgi:hypothetical protein
LQRPPMALFAAHHYGRAASASLDQGRLTKGYMTRSPPTTLSSIPLMSYFHRAHLVGNFIGQCREAAGCIDRLLRGERVSGLPVQQASRVELILK